MKEYKIKEALCNLKQSFDDLKLKFELMIEILDEYKEESESAKHEDSSLV